MAYAEFEEVPNELHDDVQADDRRGNQRTTSVFRPALIGVEGHRSLCLVRNVSPTGMMAKIYAPIAAGKAIGVEFGGGLSTSGTVAWAEDDRIGVQFSDPIDVAAILTETGKKDPQNKINRPLRLEINARGEMEIDGKVLRFDVQNISQSGIKAKVSTALKLSDEVMIRLTDLAERRAVVRWMSAGEAGLNFTRPLSFDELATWAVRRQTG